MGTENYILHDCRRKQTKLTIYLVNGYRITGYISSFDDNTIELVDEEGNRKLLYKHAVTTIEF